MRDGIIAQQLADALAAMALELPKPDEGGERQPATCP